MSAPASGRSHVTAAPLRAAAARVDLWLVPLVAPPEALRAAAGDLSCGEQAFASRLRTGGERYVLARSALRRRLAAELDVRPRDVELVTGAFGKPELASAHASELRFNLAHSEAFALIAMRQGRDVGVDLERVRAGVDAAGVVRAVFTPRERAAWHSLGGGRDPDAFFRAWVRREALAKATGRGLASPGHANDTLVVREVDGIPGHVAAVASEGTDWSLACRWRAPDARTTERPEARCAVSAG